MEATIRTNSVHLGYHFVSLVVSPILTSYRKHANTVAMRTYELRILPSIKALPKYTQRTAQCTKHKLTFSSLLELQRLLDLPSNCFLLSKEFKVSLVLLTLVTVPATFFGGENRFSVDPIPYSEEGLNSVLTNESSIIE